MAQQPELPEIKLDEASLYREEIFTDRRAGTLRRLTAVTADGSTDTTRAVLFSGQTQLLTPGGVLPLGFDIEATTLQEALNRFPDAVKLALDEAIEEGRVKPGNLVVLSGFGAGLTWGTAVMRW